MLSALMDFIHIAPQVTKIMYLYPVTLYISHRSLLLMQ